MTIILPLIIIAVIVFSKTRIPLGKARPAFSLYLVILILAVGVFYVVADAREPTPPLDTEAPDPNSDEEMQEIDSIINRFFEALHEGRIEEYDAAEQTGSWRFDYSGEQLNMFTIDGEHYFNSLIVVERKEVNDGIIEIASFTPLLPRQMPLVMKPPELTLENNNLIVTLPNQEHIIQVGFHHDFTVTQFTGNHTRNQNSGFFGYLGRQVLHMRIPKDLVINETNGLNLFYPGN